MTRGIYIRKPFSESHRKNMSLAKIGEVSNNTGGYFLSEEQKERMSLRRGENAGNWRGGISKDSHSLTNPAYKEWRVAVFERDNYTCQFCNKKGIYLEPDHIKGWAQYPELRFELENGRALCKPCHATTSNYKGRGRKKHG